MHNIVRFLDVILIRRRGYVLLFTFRLDSGLSAKSKLSACLLVRMEIIRSWTGHIALILGRVKCRPHRRTNSEPRRGGAVFFKCVHNIQRIGCRRLELRNRGVASLALSDVKFPARRQRRRVCSVFRRSGAGRRLFYRHANEVLLFCSHSNGILWVGRHKLSVIVRVSAWRGDSVTVLFRIEMIFSKADGKPRHPFRQVKVHNICLVLVGRGKVLCWLIEDGVCPKII